MNHTRTHLEHEAAHGGEAYAGVILAVQERVIGHLPQLHHDIGQFPFWVGMTDRTLFRKTSYCGRNYGFVYFVRNDEYVYCIDFASIVFNFDDQDDDEACCCLFPLYVLSLNWYKLQSTYLQNPCNVISQRSSLFSNEVNDSVSTNLCAVLHLNFSFCLVSYKRVNIMHCKKIQLTEKFL